MSYPQGSHFGQNPPPSRTKPEPQVYYGSEDYPEGSCPECGADISDENFRAKHSIYHYGDLDVPDRGHINLVTRQRQAYLQGRPLPER